VRFLRAFGRFWYDFIIGDDWKIACGVALVLVVGAVLVATTAISGSVLAPLLAAGFFAVFALAVLIDVRT
jgi:hypothetical protein